MIRDECSATAKAITLEQRIRVTLDGIEYPFRITRLEDDTHGNGAAIVLTLEISVSNESVRPAPTGQPPKPAESANKQKLKVKG
jgi:hypothetical protein